MCETKVPLIDLAAQFREIEGEILAALRRACASGRFVLGRAVEEFERRWAAYCGVRHCVGVNSGTSALHVALRCLDVGPGDEVITVPMTFISTVSAIAYVGARPVFVDIEPSRRTMDPSCLEPAITPRTRAIVPVHLYGVPADMDAIHAVADRHGLPVVEDAAQAHGALYRGRRVGSLGRVACFSFYPTKNLGAYGEGGGLVTDDDGIAARARALRDHGQFRRDVYEEVGYNYRMEAFQGAVLGVKLGLLDGWNRARAAHARRYRELLAGLPITLPASPAGCESAWHLFVVEVPDRGAVRRELAAAGVETAVHYPLPVHMQRAYAHLGLGAGTFPVSENLARHCLSLPLYPELSEEQIARTCAAVRKILG